MKIGLIGAGRLGLCLALLIENAGYKVLASDVREDYVQALNKGVLGTTEPNVHEYLWGAENIEFTTDNDRVIRECDLIFTLVATPSLEDGSYDVNAVWKVVDDFKAASDVLTGKSLVVGCTTNPGDCDLFQEQLAEYGVDVYYNPEFIAQGSIIKDLRHADMVLVGGNGHHVPDIEDIYNKIQVNKPSIHFMSTRAAELTKIAVNCFLTTKISYANQVGQVMIKDGMEDEVDTVLQAIGSDSRVGTKYLGFGFGFGGPCFPRDNRAFSAYAQQVGVQNSIGETTDNFNDEHTEFLVDYYLNKNKEELPFCFRYLTYKGGIDILTESRPYDLALRLLDEGYKVYCPEIPLSLQSQVDDRIINAIPEEEVCLVDLK